MNLNIIKDSFLVKQNLERVKKDFVLEQDYILPDIKPDIVNYIYANGNVYVSKRELLNNKVKLDGGVSLYITYLSDSGNTEIINPEIAFSEGIDISSVGDSLTFLENILIDSIEVKILNERKISIKVVLKCNVDVFLDNSIDILKGIEDFSDLQKLERTINLNVFVGSGSTKASLKENIKIQENGDIKNVLSFRYYIHNIENKISYNKVLVKADCRIDIIYMNNENKILKVTQDVPVMGFIDVVNVDESDVCNTSFRLRNILVKPNISSEQTIYVEMDFDIFTDVFKNTDVQIIDDIYGLKNNISYNSKKVSILDPNYKIIDSVFINEKVIIENINELLDTDCRVLINNKTSNNGLVRVDGEVLVNYIYSSLDNPNINSKQVNFGFSVNIPEKFENGFSINVSDESSFNILPDSSVDTQIKMNIVSLDDNGESISLIDNISVSDLNSDDDYNLVIYFVKPGDSLWKIAKMFNSTVDEIVRMNGIEDSNVINVGDRLYIPRLN